MTRVQCPNTVGSADKNVHSTIVENGKTLYHNLCPGVMDECPGSRKELTVLKTPEEWATAKGIRIMDPDGWRMDDAPEWNQPINEDEFNWRCGMSTVGPARGI